MAKKEKDKDKMESKNEFRFNHATKHPNYVFAKEGKKCKAMGITHEAETFGRKNMPLKDNPNSKDKGKAYIRNGIISQDERYMSKEPIKNLKFSAEDYSNVKSKRRNYIKQRKKTSKRSR